jgi:hypothetical protein
MPGYIGRMSRREALEALEAQLRAKPPPGISRLAEDQLRDLAAAITEARRLQAAELRDAGEKAYSQIPWLLRGPVRKIMG